MSSRSLKGFIVTGVVLTMTVVGCGGGSEESTTLTETAAPTAAPIDPATVGNITGTITLEGLAPDAELIRMAADPVCMREGKGGMTESFVVGEDGSLQNVFIYVKSGLGDRRFQPPSDPVLLDQNGCQYSPHVFGIQVGQPFEVLNSDPTLHNIHAIPEKNQEFNTGQPIEGMIFKHTFSTEEVMVPLKCDVHGWMNAYAGVLSHPFFAVSGSGGTFDLSGLPPGTYEIEAWHEQLGPMTQSVTIGEQETAEINFTFQMTS